ncbi:energy-coupling factor transporter ATPase [Mycoplasmopsis felis]|nr:energy-coupling factor transporter ATPase [Mycoplasmopsis felis]UWV78203.1 energy-coupling factor transporter ATPase [Mycoplasmopsis felis]
MIEVKNIVFSYKPGTQKPALNNVSFTIKKGEYVAILGHNGSGKSTLSKVLVGLLKPQEGSIFIDNIEYHRSTLLEIRKKIGIIFQNPDNQFIGSSVEDDIAFGLENRKIPSDLMKDIILKCATRVVDGKTPWKRTWKFIRRTKTKGCIASILALNPDVIIFDEVTSMLDPKGKNDILNLIKEIRDNREKTLISITHNMDEAILADKCLVFSNGQLIADGSPQEILNNKEIIELAKIDSPFIYKLSENLKGINPTYNEQELIDQICKLK